MTEFICSPVFTSSFKMSQKSDPDAPKCTPSILKMMNQSGDETEIGDGEAKDVEKIDEVLVNEGLLPLEDLNLHLKLHLDEIFAQAANIVCEQKPSTLAESGEDDSDTWTSDSESDSDSQISSLPSGYDSDIEWPANSVYSQLVNRLTGICRKNVELYLDTSTIFSEIYPPELILYSCPPAKILLKELRRLCILPPNTVGYLKSNDMKKYFRFIVGNAQDAIQCEEQLRDRVLFFLNCLKTPNLREFIMKCTDDGQDIIKYSCRYSIWEATLIRFLRYHSNHLSHIKIETCRTPGTLLSHKPVDVTVGTNQVFPALQELSLIFWEREPYETTLKPHELKLSPYWSDLVKSRIYFGALKKLTWMSYETLSWSEVFEPLIKSNRETLESIHVVQMDKPLCFEDMSTSRSLTIVDATVFADVINLKSLFLRIKRSFGVQVNLLPEQLEELCLDNVWVLSVDLSSALQKMSHLRKLKLAKNAPFDPNEPLLAENPNEEFGVSVDVLKSALMLRKLEDLCVRDFNFILQPKVVEPSSLSSFSSAAFLSVEIFLKRLVGIKSYKRVQPSVGDSQVSSTFLETISEIAVINEEQIRIS